MWHPGIFKPNGSWTKNLQKIDALKILFKGEDRTDEDHFPRTWLADIIAGTIMLGAAWGPAYGGLAGQYQGE